MSKQYQKYVFINYILYKMYIQHTIYNIVRNRLQNVITKNISK